MDFNDMIEKHAALKADISVATIPVTAKDASSFGIMKTDENFNITSFTEKPKTGLEDWTSEVGEDMKSQGRIFQASMGIYIFNKDIIYDTLTNDPHTDFGKEIIPEAINKKKVVAYQY